MPIPQNSKLTKSLFGDHIRAGRSVGSGSRLSDPAAALCMSNAWLSEAVRRVLPPPNHLSVRRIGRYAVKANNLVSEVGLPVLAELVSAVGKLTLDCWSA
jgi:hypothetical protein